MECLQGGDKSGLDLDSTNNRMFYHQISWNREDVGLEFIHPCGCSAAEMFANLQPHNGMNILISYLLTFVDIKEYHDL